ncbi:glycosyltransferase family 4 protein [Opitutales bacterium]|nr:glycosyltransferase family 4 protein [Opitutales bacterium]
MKFQKSPNPISYNSAKNIGFISTRFAGTDGVTLESAKWAQVLWDDKNVSYWYAGRLDRHPDISMCVPEAFFGHSENQWINERLWGTTYRSRLVSERIQEVAKYLKETLYNFVDKFHIDIIVPQNVLTIPMHLPLGVALTDFINETQIPTIAHHHDFYWERDRFAVTCVKDYLDMAFPCKGDNMRHVVINQAAQEQLSLRKGASSLLIPNVFDFDNPPLEMDEYAKDFREEVGLEEDDIFILQPTRIVPRKGIEHAIKLVGLLNDPRCKLVISHDAGDEGFEYQHMLEELAHEEGVDLRFISDRVADIRQLNKDGKKMYTLWDLYPHANLVTYPSIYEGFGNALLEALYFRVPVVVNRYSIFIQDIEPKGFRLPVMDGFVTSSVLKQVERILSDHEYRQEMVDHNYTLARKFYSYSALRRSLRTIIASLTGLSPT